AFAVWVTLAAVNARPARDARPAAPAAAALAGPFCWVWFLVPLANLFMPAVVLVSAWGRTLAAGRPEAAADRRLLGTVLLVCWWAAGVVFLALWCLFTPFASLVGTPADPQNTALVSLTTAGPMRWY